ncbi:MgtC/SapB family protein [Cribrihabitans pelagius]|uniref:MgtC/SapB family protein n=1 Tax=Cribrihabitans pelagius TaxID=1765746 RepID=UPI003B5B99C2
MMDLFAKEIAISFGMPWQVLLFRLLGALLFTGLIGFEREVVRRPAGLRTHMLTGMASCVYCLVMLHLLESASERGDQVRVDPIRVVEAVTQGVAFLAAGLIIYTRGKVRGLTTGASMWLAAAIGLACGLGLWFLATATTVLALIIIRVIKLGEKAAGTYTAGPEEDAEEQSER